MRTRIMYLENKSAGLTGPCRIGRVRFSKTGATLYYGGSSFQSLKGLGFKANYIDIETGEHFWISGPRRDGADGLYGRITQPEDVDEDVAEAYWRDIRKCGAPPRPKDGGSPIRNPVLADPERTGRVPDTSHGRKGSRIAGLIQSAGSGR